MRQQARGVPICVERSPQGHTHYFGNRGDRRAIRLLDFRPISVGPLDSPASGPCKGQFVALDFVSATHWVLGREFDSADIPPANMQVGEKN